MITLLSKIFIKNHTDFKDASVRRAYGMLCGVCGIILNLFLFAVKFLAGTLTGSIAITADAFNNLADAGSSIITLYTMLGLVSGVYSHPNPTSHERYIRPPAVPIQERN